MTLKRKALGERGEVLAVARLRNLGYTIVGRNFRARGGEIDIIAMDDRTVVFVEVKTRIGHGFGRPAEAVTTTKQRKISLAALEYLSQMDLHDQPARFDVVAVEYETSGSTTARIEVFKNAFELWGVT